MDPSHHPSPHPRSAMRTSLPAAEAEYRSLAAWVKGPSLAVSPKRMRTVRMTEETIPSTRTVEAVLLNQLPVDPTELPSLRPSVSHPSLRPEPEVAELLAILATTLLLVVDNLSEGRSRTSTRTMNVPIPTPRASGILVGKRKRRDSFRPLPGSSRVTPKRGTKTDRDETHPVQSTKAARVDGRPGLTPIFADPTRCTVEVGAATTRATMRITAISWLSPTTGTRSRSIISVVQAPSAARCPLPLVSFPSHQQRGPTVRVP
jgi:hypothetical protein